MNALLIFVDNVAMLVDKVALFDADNEHVPSEVTSPAPRSTPTSASWPAQLLGSVSVGPKAQVELPARTNALANPALSRLNASHSPPRMPLMVRR
jgi:hypothetical protein